MINAEQLTLFNAELNENTDSINFGSSNVLSLDGARRFRKIKNMQVAYDDIYDSVKHVRLRAETLKGDVFNSRRA